MNVIMEMASEVRRTLCNAISLSGYSDFPPVAQQTAPTADRPAHWDKSHRGGRVRLADD
jgi:hypothetical protein